MRTRRLTLLAPSMIVLVMIVLGLLLASPGSARVLGAEEEDATLPSRVANAIARAELSLDGASQAIDSGDTQAAVASLNSLRLNLARAEKAARRQMGAAPADEEAETTPGPDSMIAVLALDQATITRVSALFDAKTGVVVNNLALGLVAARNSRGRLLTAVVKLDPEGAGADYADGMADSVETYDDEVANISEALADDRLSPVGKQALSVAVNGSKAARTKVTNAFGGGE